MHSLIELWPSWGQLFKLLWSVFWEFFVIGIGVKFYLRNVAVKQFEQEKGAIQKFIDKRLPKARRDAIKAHYLNRHGHKDVIACRQESCVLI